MGRQRLGTQRVLSQPQFPADTLKECERQKWQAELRAALLRKDEDERGLRKAAERLEAKAFDLERQRRKAQRQEQYDEECRQRGVELQLRREQRERQEREAEERQRQREEEEEVRQKEEEERERLARAPRPCGPCRGTGSCPLCAGAGRCFQDFYSPAVKMCAAFEFGRKPQGCVGCGGHSPGVAGKMQEGTGKCANCGGAGKIWPPASPPSAEGSRSPVSRRQSLGPRSLLRRGSTFRLKQNLCAARVSVTPAAPAPAAPALPPVRVGAPPQAGPPALVVAAGGGKVKPTPPTVVPPALPSIGGPSGQAGRF